GVVPAFAAVPEVFVAGIARVADPSPAVTAAERMKEWEKVRSPAGFDPEAARVLWGRALLRFVADDPPGRLPVVPEVLPVVAAGRGPVLRDRRGTLEGRGRAGRRRRAALLGRPGARGPGP